MITVECTDISAILDNKKIDRRYWLNMHPFEIVRDIFLEAGISSSLLDTTTVDYTSTSNPDYSDVSHWILSKLDVDYGPIQISKGISDGTGAKGLIEDVCGLIWASFYPEEDGIFRLKLFDETAAKVRHISADDFQDLEQTSTVNPLYTQTTINAVKFTRKHYARAQLLPDGWSDGMAESQEVTVGFTHTDDTAKQKYDYLSDSDGLHTLTFETDWLVGPSGMLSPRRNRGSGPEEDTLSNRPGYLGTVGNFLVADHTDFLVDQGYTYMGLSGTKATIAPAKDVRRLLGRGRAFDFTINAESSVSASRPAYLLIEGPGYVLNQDSSGTYSVDELQYQQEVIKVTGVSLEKLSDFLTDEDEETTETTDLPGTVALISGSPTVIGTGTTFTSFFQAGGKIRIQRGTSNTFDEFDILSVTDDGTLTLTAGYPYASFSRQQYRYNVLSGGSTIDVFYSGHYYGASASSEGNPEIGDQLGLWLAPGYAGPSGTRINFWRSANIAGTTMSKNESLPTGKNPNPDWTVANAYKLYYPVRTRVTIEGTAGDNGTYPFNIGTSQWAALGSPASGRGQFGTINGFNTAALAWYLRSNVVASDAGYPEDTDDQQWFPRVWDITVLVHAAERRIKRFAKGVPRFRVTLPLRHADLQLGDFISLEDDVPLYEGRDGLNSDVILEIVAKEVDALGDAPGVNLELAWVRDDGVSYSPTFGYAAKGPAPKIRTSAPQIVTITTGVTLATTTGEIIFMKKARTGGGEQ